MGVKVGFHGVYSHESEGVGLGEKDEPRRVNALAQSEDSSRMKRSKGAEK